MATIDLNNDNLESTIADNDLVVIDFWAPWCGPCQAFKPIYEEVATKHPEITFAKCDTEEQPELASLFQVRSIPTVMVFREQVLVFNQPGMLPQAALEELLDKVAQLDQRR